MSFEKRRLEIISLAAEQALKLPFKKDNFWFLDDLRDNFYFATHLYAAVHEDTISLSSDKKDSEKLAVEVILDGLRLQDRSPESDTYGHWPLHLSPKPSVAQPHPLPAELLSSFFLHFYNVYQDTFPTDLKEELQRSFQHIYESTFLDRVPESFSHHESKLYANQLMFGQYFNDQALANRGYKNMKELYEHVNEYGFREYGALPWLWHWTQAVTFARQFVVNTKSSDLLSKLLNLLWKNRVDFYFKGTWIGAHSRGLPHDIPEDRNNVIDYIQFGDFDIPKALPRLEGAGFLNHQVSNDLNDRATSHKKALEIKKKINMYMERDKVNHEAIHHYVYMTSDYALGGIWERTEEHMNEQHRWDVTLPIQTDGINQAYFFHPSEDYVAGDERHESNRSNVMFNKNVIAATYDLTNSGCNHVIGVLPKGSWLIEETNLYGLVDQSYFAIHLMHSFSHEKKEDRMLLKSEGKENGVVMEVISTEEASQYNITSLNQFKSSMEKQKAIFQINDNNTLKINYQSIHTDSLSIESSLDLKEKNCKRTVNGEDVNFIDYEV
ncbi:hypothetical protein CR203_13870 [Salipaludibacillus neizhouensis]|uniref:Heparin-sulfate lyase N-terminal domain-containing protein n=1 Tax=Salipaludibacillus neizhouensis TaxID=885475 RepID=A0A3A9K8R8_9BACI|nr:hypothetical protein [Salipaludibacillus neizhouensis]RKL66912.1 hypothetical protein CR203_13870 [Salipaludibacillus neizhouensis]